jgi:hypothetical protein
MLFQEVGDAPADYGCFHKIDGIDSGWAARRDGAHVRIY